MNIPDTFEPLPLKSQPVHPSETFAITLWVPFKKYIVTSPLISEVFKA